MEELRMITKLHIASGILLGAINVQELLRILAAVGGIAVTPWRFLCDPEGESSPDQADGAGYLWCRI